MIFQNACALYVLINYFTCQQGKKSTNRLFFSQKIWKNHAYDKKRSRDSFAEKRIWWRRCIFVILGYVSWTMNDILLVWIDIFHSILNLPNNNPFEEWIYIITFLLNWTFILQTLCAKYCISNLRITYELDISPSIIRLLQGLLDDDIFTLSS